MLFACYGFSADAFSYLFRSDAAQLGLSLGPVHRFFLSLRNAGITVAGGAAVLLYLGLRKTLYFGNTAPLLIALSLLFLITAGVPGTPLLWALPFLLAFIGGVFADAYETPPGKLAIAAAGAIVLLQAIFCVLSLPGLL